MPEEILELVYQNSCTDPVTYQYFNHYFNYRTIVYNNEIDKNVVEMVILPLKEFENDDSDEPVKLILSTPGGVISDGLLLCNIIDNYKKPLKIYILGYACSLGTVILASGNNNPNVTKYCYPFSFSLFHSGYSSIKGESTSVEDAIDFDRKIDKTIEDYIVKNTKITREEYKEHRRHQWYLTSYEMKEKGLIDIIIGEDDTNDK